MTRKLYTAVLLLSLAGISALADPVPAQEQESFSAERLFTGSVQFGYSGGKSIFVAGKFSNFIQGLPVCARLGLGVVKFDPGDAWMARRVFINNATNGTARDHGTIWSGRLDVLYPVNITPSLKNTFLFGGPRYSSFRGYFEYIGGAETFDVFTQQWGIGGGLETGFPISPRVDLLATLGTDYYFRSTIDGHDTYYRPNGDDTHPIDNYTYADADKAINQPELELNLMLGVAYHF